MNRIVFPFFITAVLLVISCNQSTETGPIDSAQNDSTASDTLSELVLEESSVVTVSGSKIALNKGEWYCRATYMEHDKSRGMLIFRQENGVVREIVSNPWNREGKLQLSSERDLKLNKGSLYELIYYFQYENPELKSNKPSGFYLIDIIPRGSYFSSAERYSDSAQKPFQYQNGALGQFYDDLNGGAVTFENSDGKPVLFYSKLPSSEKIPVSCEAFSSDALHVRLPISEADGFFCWRDGEWIYTDLEGRRRTFRNSKM